MNLISRTELVDSINRGEVTLAMTMGAWQYEHGHIPGSINIPNAAAAAEHLQLHDAIVVYCSNPACTASLIAYQQLVAAGYTDVRRYAGGLDDWLSAGLPLATTV